ATGPTAPVTSTETYTGPSGTLGFELVYAECCLGAAVLQVDLPFSNLPNDMPEAGSLALIGMALAGIGWSSRRRAH
ncbi:MAG: PEP-CTERM sorting domain-containing protein, partial [Candidatus Accumulibacter sp.]|nr:PEP-CTERM sorting domain-containing protein [Accumulibacter sp.]